ncbi:hypothetical protein F4556_003407 [Kitasatospora gansuensis]|uniref:Uncharacterized protein n=1 Tax=Kitasatospora gansuensis TaxID=258050 RepID=A0A7W7SD37_9ACTN|nr:hypothetical protein [Kitasatospora gansuensis]MBB4947872.1 hypothetical protein [Kitasatospora gansuensis]
MSAPGPAEQVIHHWILTVQRVNGQLETFDGLTPDRPGITRQSVYYEALRLVAERMGVSATATIHFSLGSNKL